MLLLSIGMQSSVFVYNLCITIFVSFSVVYKKVTKQQHEKATFCEREQYEDDF